MLLAARTRRFVSPRNGARPERMRLLIVEDEVRMLELLGKGLSESGFDVSTAAD